MRLVLRSANNRELIAVTRPPIMKPKEITVTFSPALAEADAEKLEARFEEKAGVCPLISCGHCIHTLMRKYRRVCGCSERRKVLFPPTGQHRRLEARNRRLYSHCSHELLNTLAKSERDRANGRRYFAVIPVEIDARPTCSIPPQGES